ncbi:unnamed protein product [Clonostachys rhizophaga]|uniref:FAD-binding domain-containing protein n=1 Tax=Clonostachys rhizophaga TaxID=160324 RepID=A0A9N9VGQ9_9HYPO|nr:unnamed protein product [Clonostachys rhizophaga]
MAMLRLEAILGEAGEVDGNVAPAPLIKTDEKEEVVNEYRHWGDTAKFVIESLQKPDVWAVFEHPPANTYHKGLVCIMGDAAHAAMSHKGDGWYGTRGCLRPG